MKRIKKHFLIFLRYLKMDIMYDMTSRTNFLIMLGVEVFYTVAFLLFFNVLYGNIKTLAGWTYYEMLLLLGFDAVMSELLVGFIFANGANALPKRVLTGYVDYFLLKPVSNILFLMVLQPYFPSIFSTGFGFILMGIALSHLTISLSITNIVGALIITCCGFLISACIMITISSLAFVFANAQLLPRIGFMSTISFSGRPHQMYNTLLLKSVFFLILPAVFLSSVPVYSLTHTVSFKLLILAVTLSCLFVFLTKKIWDAVITNYTSASS